MLSDISDADNAILDQSAVSAQLEVTYLTIFADSNPRPCSGTYFGGDFGVLVLIPTESHQLTAI